MNTKRLLYLLLSIAILQSGNASACFCCLTDKQKDDPRLQQMFLSSMLANDFCNNNGWQRDPSLEARPTNPQDLSTSGLEIYDTMKNCKLVTIPDPDEVIRLFGILRNAPKTILATFMVDMTKSKDDITNGCYVKIWDTATGAHLFGIPDHAWGGKFNHKGDKLIVYGEGKAQVWDIKSHKCVLTLPCKGTCLAEFSKHDDKILTKSGDGVKIWNSQTGKCLATIKNVDKTYHIFSAKFDATGNYVITEGCPAEFDATTRNCFTITGNEQSKTWIARTGKCWHIINKNK